MIMEQNLIYTVKDQNLINAILNEPSVWNAELNSSEEKVTLFRSSQRGLWT